MLVLLETNAHHKLCEIWNLKKIFGINFWFWTIYLFSSRQFGFIAFKNADDGKSVFFHMSEVQNEFGKELKVYFYEIYSLFNKRSYKKQKKQVLHIK